MKKTLALLVLSFCFLQPLVFAQSLNYNLQPEDSSINFIGKSTFHDFEGKVGVVKGNLNFDSNSAVARGLIEAQVFSFKTGVSQRDSNMYKMFGADIFPEVIFEIQDADFTNFNQQPVVMNGVLTMHGVSKPFNIQAQMTKYKDGYWCQGAFYISLKDFKLSPPSVLGLIRVNDRVYVQFKVLFQRSSN